MAELDTKQQMEEALKELRTTIEAGTKKQLDAYDQEKTARINDALDKQEKASEKLMLDLKKEQEKTADLEVRFKELEKIASQPGAGKGDEKALVKEELKALHKFFSAGEQKMSTDEVKYLRSDSDVDGGFLAPAEMTTEILKNITEISPIRQVASVRQVGRGRIELPVRSALVASTWEGEAEAVGNSNSQYALLKMPLHKLMINVPVTIEELQDAAFNIEAEVNMDVQEEIARKEGDAFVNGRGPGNKEPMGFMVDAGVGYRATGSASALTMDSIILLGGDIKTGYNPVYLFNRKTRAQIRVLKDGVSQYLWQAGNIAAGVPNTLNGFNYIETPGMDDIAANAYPIIFGDFKKAYLIGDRMALSIIRDPYSRKKEGIVEFTFIKRVGGRVVKTEALKKLKVAVS